MVRPFELAARRRFALGYLCAAAALVPAVIAACYSTGDGTPPPPNTFYFPVGMTVSGGGNVLYVVNSDFDLQWNGGTIQSYDLYAIREDAAISAAGYSLDPALPFPEGGGAREFLDGATHAANGVTNLCAEGVTTFQADGGFVSSCAPFINSTYYERDSVTIGAFATDIQLSPWGNRLYVPVRGDASLTWLSVTPDNSTTHPARDQVATDSEGGATNGYAPFALACGQNTNGGRCDAQHHAGVDPLEPGNSRHLTMPGEPFAMTQSSDGTAIVLTHQSETDTSLFLTGLTVDGGLAGNSEGYPSMQYVIDAGLPMGGDGIGTVPQPPQAYGCNDAGLSGDGGPCVGLPQPAFLETNNTTAELNLIRYYPDDGTGSTLPRPYIVLERTYPITALSSGTDSRGIAFDTSQRALCLAHNSFPSAHSEQCARLPVPTYIGHRDPNTLLIGTTGGPSPTDANTYDADAFSILNVVGLDTGPSHVYLAPIVDSDGNYSMRVFIVCFNQNTIDVYNPTTGLIEANIQVGAGPFAMAFDPFKPLDVAMHAQVTRSDVPVPDTDAAGGTISNPNYRFAYVASFTNSYVQVIDLDDSQPDKSTFETVVYTLGTPSVPKGNQ